MTTNWNEVLSNIVKKFSADVGTLHRLNKKDNCLYLVTYTGDLPESITSATKRIPITKGTIAAVTVLEKKPIVMGNITTDPSQIVLPMERNLDFKGIVTVPIFRGEDVVGSLGIGCIKERLFSQEEINQLMEEGRKIADQLIEEQDKL